MVIFDTFSNKKIELKKPQKGPIKFFVCGPTVYDFSHIGHARTQIIFDAFVKYLRYKKIKTFYLQNITDIDDKIIERAKKENVNPLSLAKKFEKEYYKDLKALKIDSIDKFARASEHISDIQKQITDLINKGYAYQTSNGIYFEVKKFSQYGKLSKQNLEKLRPGYRIEADSQKKDPLDFGLWKFPEIKNLPTIPKTTKIQSKIIDGVFMWSSPWGWGRPGWHIEDTAITEKYFGVQYDIHGGGADLKFPHHECEIAQQEAASGKSPLVKIWMHTGFLLVNSEKMSKSLGNFITINDFLKKYSFQVIRLMALSYHYRTPLDYTENLANQTQNALSAIEEFIEKLYFVSEKNIGKKTNIKNFKNIIDDFNHNFENALDDDFNTQKAVASIFDLISEIQKNIWQLSPAQANLIVKNIQTKLKIFELDIKACKIPAKIKVLAIKRETLRNNKHFIPADALRTEMEMLGYIIEDTPLGPFVRVKT